MLKMELLAELQRTIDKIASGEKPFKEGFKHIVEMVEAAKSIFEAGES